MADPINTGESNNSSRVDPEVAASARKSAQPDGLVYDTSMETNTGPGNFWTLTVVLIVIVLLLTVLFAFFR